MGIISYSHTESMIRHYKFAARENFPSSQPESQIINDRLESMEIIPSSQTEAHIIRQDGGY